MAIAFGSLLTSGNGGTTSITTASVTPNASELTLLVFRSEGNTNATPTVSGNGLTWTKLSITGGTAVYQIWYSIGGSPSAGAISVTNLTSGSENLWFVVSFTGTATTSIFPQTSFSTGSGTALSTTLAGSITAGNTAFGFGSRSAGTQSYTPGTNFTEIGEASSGSRSGAIEYQLNKTDDAVIDMSSSTSGGWTMIGVEIAAAAVSSGNFFLLF